MDEWVDIWNAPYFIAGNKKQGHININIHLFRDITV